MAINREVRVDFVGKDRTKGASSSVVAGIKRVNKEIDGIATRAVAAQRAFSALTIGFAGVNAIRTLGDLQESMLRVKNTSLDYARDQQFLSKQTRALNLDLQAAAESYADILVLQNTGFLSGSQSQSLFIGFQETAKKFGVGAEDIKFALRGIRQAMAAGVIRAQEFDQIFDAMPTVMNSVAKNLGLTTQELLELRTASSLSSKTLIEALIPALREADRSAASASENINASLVNLASSYKRALLAFEEPIGDAVGDFAQIAGDAIDGLVEHSDKIKYVGIAIAAAYGGPALQAIVANNAERLKGIKVTLDQAKATAINNQRLSIEAQRSVQIAESRARVATSNAAYLKTEILRTQDQQKKIALSTSYKVALTQEAAAIKGVAAAQLSASAAATTYAASQRTATAASLLFTSAVAKLNDVLKANAGFAALGALLLIISKVRDGSKEIREMQSALEDLDARSATLGQRAFDELAGTREALEIKLYKLQKERLAVQLRINEAKAKEITGNESLKDSGRDLAANAEREYAKLSASIREAGNALQELSRKQEQFLRDDLISKHYQSVADAFDKTYAKIADPRLGIPGLIDKFLPTRAKLQELEDKLAQARAAFNQPGDNADRNAVINAIQEEIRAVEASIPANKRYADAKEASRKAVVALNESLLTERERIQKTFDDAKATIEVGIKYKLIDDVAGKEQAVLDAKNKALKKLDQAELDRIEKHRQDMKDTREKVVQDTRDYNARLIAARTVLNPGEGEAERFRAEILALNSERGGAIKSDEDYYLLVQAAFTRHKDAMAGIAEDLKNEQTKTWADLSGADQIQAVGQIASNFVSAFEQQVDAYQVLTDNMTETERQAAVQSNKINKKKFEQNKKFSIAQAIISTLTGASNALAVQPPGLGIALAASIIAMGMRNVANIRSTSFGSGASISTGGGAVATPAAVEPEVTGTASERIIMIVAGNFQSQEEAMAEVARRQRDAYQQGLINTNPDGSPDFRNVPDRVVRLR